jgi:electron transport complex protein RnfG
MTKYAKYVKQGWLVLLLALMFGAALAGVNSALGPRIRLNEKNSIYDQVPNIVPGADPARTERISKTVLKVYDKKGQAIGWAVTARGMGYADQIKALIGLDATASTITGLFIIDQKETPGLGSKIASPWNRQFIGQPTDKPLVVLKGMTKAQRAEKDDRIDAISGATISSRALTEKVVNPALARFRKKLQAGELKSDN